MGEKIDMFSEKYQKGINYLEDKVSGLPDNPKRKRKKPSKKRKRYLKEGEHRKVLNSFFDRIL